MAEDCLSLWKQWYRRALRPTCAAECSQHGESPSCHASRHAGITLAQDMFRPSCRASGLRQERLVAQLPLHRAQMRQESLLGWRRRRFGAVLRKAGARDKTAAATTTAPVSRSVISSMRLVYVQAPDLKGRWLSRSCFASALSAEPENCPAWTEVMAVRGVLMLRKTGATSRCLLLLPPVGLQQSPKAVSEAWMPGINHPRSKHLLLRSRGSSLRLHICHAVPCGS